MAIFESEPPVQPRSFSVERASVARRAGISAAVGTGIEFFDFTIYAYLATTIAPLFFAAHDQMVGLLATLGVYAIGYIARPLGAVIFGRLGDQRGRRPTLLLTVTLMGVATALTGLLPTYATIGVAAPILLTVLRIGQSIAAGGEIGGAAVLVAESAPRKRRGILGSSTSLGATIGATLAALVVGVVSLLPGHALATWGWRATFLISVPLLIVCLIYRLRVEESPIFQQMVAEHTPVKAPVSGVLARRKKGLLKVALITFAVTTTGKLSSLYLVVHFAELGYPVSVSVWFAASFTLASATVMVYAGHLSDQWGRRRIMTIGFGGFIALAIPAYLLMDVNLIAAAVLVLILNLFHGLNLAVYFTAFAEQFPNEFRYTGVALGYNLGSVIGGVAASLVATALVASTGIAISPSFYIVFAAVIGLATLGTLRDRSQAEL
ncbi:MFS transporter [Nocardia jiangxiensis]|uniref:MFS transporter n=1 Tax=Nocardia jiangxiensis TaxID=282685 RepID=A0ABW6SE83_9NOCA